MRYASLTIGSALLIAVASFAAQKKGKPHPHHVVEIVGQPVLSAVKVKLDKPRRVIMDGRGGMLIADSGANKVFRVAKDGKVTTLADKLNEPSGLCRDDKGNVYISNHADGAEKKGNVIRIDKAGKQSIIAKHLTGPKGMACGPDGKLYVAMFDESRIITIDSKGKIAEFAGDINTPAGLCFDKSGYLLAVSSVDGEVTRIDEKGKGKKLCEGLSIPSDIAIGPDGEIVVANYGGTQLTRVMPNGKTRQFLAVPQQTIGLCFTKAGNLVVVNWANSWAIKATIRMFVPCPHCNKKIPIRLRPRDRTPPKKVI